MTRKIVKRSTFLEPQDHWPTTPTSWRRWCSGIMQDSHSCDPGSIPGRRILFAYPTGCQQLVVPVPKEGTPTHQLARVA